MNREIKFRAWNKKEELMLTVDCIEFVGELVGNVGVGYIAHKEGIPELQEYIEGFARYENVYASPLKDCVLLQYTGKKDKNGNEIYEGDLIECAYCKKEYGEVVWNKEMLRFELKWKDKNCGNARHTRIDNWSNVVGNIYEKSELLKLVKKSKVYWDKTQNKYIKSLIK